MSNPQPAKETSAPVPVADLNSEEFLNRIGHLVRTVRHSMKELGFDEAVEKAAQIIPDARGRLDYIAAMTADAAERVLNAVDRAQPVQDELEERAQKLSAQWAGWFEVPAEKEEVRAMVLETRVFLESISTSTGATKNELLEITMAQDFQDLTGQVLKKLTVLVQQIEHQLLDLIVDSAYSEADRDQVRKRIYEKAAEAAPDKENPLLNGPQIKPNAAEAVTNQDEVDDLLSELGF